MLPRKYRVESVLSKRVRIRPKGSGSDQKDPDSKGVRTDKQHREERKGDGKFLLDGLLHFYQCCGAGAGGAEIILGPRAGAENKF